ncbi:MAG TPA: PAS domain S-box protein [Candidatus Competibacteraceae bacterium]|nr:PAS domain S-box protein [Candidatus Competibacteraceae bacterium]MCP5134625.1 PAS domain S-box protein [Gammaproteobacteria bacterium]HPF57967.1 PAS domain S-box protein [Candidatus Competibacteraceae bacterium]HRY17425.1 PAS domain S-box protein [Candidatus Competibacteraceae bacterium]
MSDNEDRLLKEIEALRHVVANRDHTLLSLTRRMDQIIETIQVERNDLDQAIKRERELSRFVQQVLASMQDMLIVTNPEGVIIQANPAAYRKLGFEPETLLGVAVDTLLPSEALAAYEQGLPAQRTVSASTWVEAIACRGNVQKEHRLLKQDGEPAGFFQVGAEFFYSPQGRFEGVVITASDFTERKQAEQALVDSESWLRRLLDGSPIPLFVINQNHQLIYWNHACEAMTGIPAKQVIGTRDHWRTFYNAPRPCLVDWVLDNASLNEIVQHYPAGIRERELAERILEGEDYFSKPGKWLYFTAAPIRDNQGRIVAAMESVQDMTERRQAELALADSETRLHHMLDGNPVPLFVINREHQVTHWNRACTALTGVTAGQVIGTCQHWQPFYDAPRPILVDLVLEGAQQEEINRHYPAGIRERALAERFLEGETYLSKLGKWLYFTAAPIHDNQGRLIAAMESLQDITERKEAELALADSEIRLRHMLDGSPVPLFVINREHQVTHWNRACVALTGIAAEKMIGTRHQWQAFYRSSRPVLADFALEDIPQEEVSKHYPSGIRERRLAGRVLEGDAYISKLGKWLYFTATSIRDSQGHIVAAMESIQDITERKENEQALQLAASVFEHAHEGIIITDADGIIIEVNKTFEEITGYLRQESIGQNPKILQSGLHNAGFYTDLWQRIAEHGYWSGEIWNRRKNGEVYPQTTSISSVRNIDGEITYYVGLFADISILKESQQRLEHMAYYDPLTGLPNRALLADRLRLALAKAQRDHRILAICYLDLDGFKPINDHWGHAAGDELLVQVAQRFQQSVRGDDTVARLGGDEFVVLLNNLDSIEEGEQIVERFLQMLASPFVLSALPATISASIGVTFFPNDGSDPDTLVRHADQAMYRAKQDGRNCYHLFDPERDRRAQIHRERLERIRRGWANEEFCLYYQPKVDMRQGRVIGVEALVRWHHPKEGILPPAAFIGAVENSDFSPAFSRWVLKTAIRQIEIWHRAGLALPVSVNLSARHLQQPDFATQIQSLLAQHPHVRPDWLEIEVLETTALDETQRVFQIISECRQLGVRFAIDDFGTGYSSLTYLKHLPAQILKIDQSFIRDMLFDPGDLAIVRGIIGLTTAFKLEVIAEGVESVEHGTLLLRLGCNHAQGYAIARPMPSGEILDWVGGWRKPDAWNAAVELGL